MKVARRFFDPRDIEIRAFGDRFTDNRRAMIGHKRAILQVFQSKEAATGKILHTLTCIAALNRRMRHNTAAFMSAEAIEIYRSPTWAD